MNAHLYKRDQEAVIVLHGILNRPFVMGRIVRSLTGKGYAVFNWGYPSREKTVQEFAEDLNAHIKSLPEFKTLHFVGFSLGAIIIRYFLTHFPLKNAGRFVMIAPPNHGSEKAEKMYSHFWFRWLYGKASILQLRASEKDFFQECGIPPVPFGIIAGYKGDNRGYSRAFPGDNDGSVSLESARLEGAQDFIQLKGRHTLLLISEETCRNVLNFLESGQFQEPE